jgi:hypothetical protein
VAESRQLIYPGNGKGSFLASRVYGRGWAPFTALAGTGDFTSDGRPDLLTRKAAGDLLLYRGNGAGGFQSGHTVIGYRWSTVRILGSTIDPTPAPAAPAP